jgi:hypothetical protein
VLPADLAVDPFGDDIAVFAREGSFLVSACRFE